VQARHVQDGVRLAAVLRVIRETLFILAGSLEPLTYVEKEKKEKEKKRKEK
jgi:hypothetical protein